MSVQPIDLQVLFSRLNEISREQAVHKDAVIQGQAVTAREIVQKSDEKGKTVTETNTEEEGPETVADQHEQDSGSEQGDRRKHESQKKEKPRYFQDPDLGQNIDISG
ncbi:MAG: hypothetical protein ACLFNT_13455 [Spirochaetales bacterium]